MRSIYKHIKSIIPNQWKYPLWYVAKSPQRKIGIFTLYTDIKGIIIFFFRNLFPKRKLKPISICTGIYNRSDNYLLQLLKSINETDNQHLIELSVFDCGSDDIANLEAEIRKNWKGKLVFSQEQVSFARSYTFNKAVDQSTHNIILICDADLSLPENIVQLCNNYTGKRTVWYPIYFFVYKNKPHVVDEANGMWEQYASRGMVACLKESFNKVGRLNEKYKVWGEEDVDLWERFHKQHFAVIRNRQKGLFHHWHQTFNKKFMHMND